MAMGEEEKINRPETEGFRSGMVTAFLIIPAAKIVYPRGIPGGNIGGN